MRNCGMQCNGRFFSPSLPLSPFARLASISHHQTVSQTVFVSLPSPFGQGGRQGLPREEGGKATNPSIPSTFPSETNDASAIRNTYTTLSRWERGEGEALILLHLSLSLPRRSSYSANFVKGVVNLELRQMLALRCSRHDNAGHDCDRDRRQHNGRGRQRQEQKHDAKLCVVRESFREEEENKKCQMLCHLQNCARSLARSLAGCNVAAPFYLTPRSHNGECTRQLF